MFGFIHESIKQLVCRKYGAEIWKKIIEAAKFEAGTECKMNHYYEDEETFRLVNGVATVIGIPTDEVWEAYGGFLIQFTMETGWDEMLKSLASDLQGFLNNLDALHYFIDHVVYKAHLKGPSFRCEVNSDNTITLHYYSKRSGLYPIVKGQLILLQNGKHMLYLCSPNVTTVRELLDKSLHLSDIPLHDATRDLILLNQSRMSQVELNKKLEETTLELKKMAEDLEAEKEKTDSLLRELLPASVAEQLRHGKTVDACKNCCFSQSKVETIGDAYMVVGGVPEECANHAVKVCNMAIGMLWESRSVLSPVTNRPIQVRLKFESKVKRRTCEFAYLLSEAEGLESVNTLKLFTSDENQSIDGYSELHDTSGLVNAKKGNENPKMEQNGAVAASETVQGNSREPADINRSFFKFRKNRVADVGPSKSCCIM